jgi:hypothetical protein
MKKNLIFLVVLISALQSITKGQEFFSFSLENDPDTTIHRISKFGNKILRTTVEEYTSDSYFSEEAFLEAKLVFERIDSTIFVVPEELLDITNEEINELLLGGFLTRGDPKYVPDSWKFISRSSEKIFQLKGKMVSFVSREINGYFTFWKHVFFLTGFFFFLEGIFRLIHKNKMKQKMPGGYFILFGLVFSVGMILAYYLFKMSTNVWEWVDGVNLLGIILMIIFFLWKSKNVEEEGILEYPGLV